MTTLHESDIEDAALEWLGELGWKIAHGPDIAPDTPASERDDYGQVVLERRLRDALGELNPTLPAVHNGHGPWTSISCSSVGNPSSRSAGKSLGPLPCKSCCVG